MEGMEVAVKGYVKKILEDIKGLNRASDFFDIGEKEIPEKIFNILSSREFTYLTKIKSEVYKKDMLERIEKSYSKKMPLNFYLSLSGGYHARIKETESLTFDVGLSELLALLQVKKFIAKAKPFYKFGIQFTIFLDNRCPEAANGVPVADTERFAVQLKNYIKKLELDDEIGVMVESEVVSKEEYENKLKLMEPKFPIKEASDSDYKNARRFSNIKPGKDFIAKTQRFKSASKVSRAFICEYARRNNGIWLVQRAGEFAYAFRSFPGGDSRIQCGAVALLYGENKIIKPVLITSQNFKNYKLRDIKLPEEEYFLPKVIVAQK
jgi:hypothetical protein